MMLFKLDTVKHIDDGEKRIISVTYNNSTKSISYKIKSFKELYNATDLGFFFGLIEYLDNNKHILLKEIKRKRVIYRSKRLK